MAKINHQIVKQLSEEIGCPILEMFKPIDNDKWYVCFEEYTYIDGEDQIVHLDEMLEALEEYDNIENLTNEVYEDDFNYFEQITFEWSE